jgi:hypothetical protein
MSAEPFHKLCNFETMRIWQRGFTDHRIRIACGL